MNSVVVVVGGIYFDYSVVFAVEVAVARAKGAFSINFTDDCSEEENDDVY